MSPALRDRIERVSRRLAFATAAAIVVCLLGPILVILGAAVIQGIARGEAPPHGGLAWAPGYPPFDPQLWLIWIPIAVIAVWIVLTIPVPLTRARGLGRGMQFGLLLVIFAASTILIAGFYRPVFPGWGVQWAPTVILVIGGVLLLRIVLGWLRLVPKSWRTYLDADGDPEPGPPRYGPGSGPLSEVPQ